MPYFSTQRKKALAFLILMNEYLDENSSESDSDSSNQDPSGDPLPPAKHSPKKSSRKPQGSSVISEEACCIIGKSYAVKLAKLPQLQRIFAEKLINDVLTQAELGSLRRESVVKLSGAPTLAVLKRNKAIKKNMPMKRRRAKTSENSEDSKKKLKGNEDSDSILEEQERDMLYFEIENVDVKQEIMDDFI